MGVGRLPQQQTKGQKMTYSNTSLTRLVTCPARFYEEYNKKTKPSLAVSSFLLGGRGIHEGIAHYLNLCVKAEECPNEEALELALKHLGTLEDLMDPEVREDARQVLRNFASRYEMILDEEDERLVEFAFGIDADRKLCGFEDKKAVFRGRIDYGMRRDAYGMVCDWKSDRSNIVPQTPPIQIKRYAAALSLRWDDLVGITGRIVNVRYSNKTAEWELSCEQQDEWLDEIFESIELADKWNSWHGQVGHHCGYCPYQMECEYLAEARQQLGDKINLTGRTVVAYADAYLALSAHLKSLEAALKTYANNEGPVNLSDGRKLGYVSTTKSVQAVKTAEIVRDMLKHGVSEENIWSGINLGKGTMSNILKGKDIKIEEDGRKINKKDYVNRFLETERSSKFKAYTPEPEEEKEESYGGP